MAPSDDFDSIERDQISQSDQSCIKAKVKQNEDEAAMKRLKNNIKTNHNSHERVKFSAYSGTVTSRKLQLLIGTALVALPLFITNGLVLT